MYVYVRVLHRVRVRECVSFYVRVHVCASVCVRVSVIHTVVVGCVFFEVVITGGVVVEVVAVVTYVSSGIHNAFLAMRVWPLCH